jgi:hypothetical protein
MATTPGFTTGTGTVPTASRAFPTGKVKRFNEDRGISKDRPPRTNYAENEGRHKVR